MTDESRYVRNRICPFAYFDERTGRLWLATEAERRASEADEDWLDELVPLYDLNIEDRS